MRFEYFAIELPSLKSQLKASNLKQAHHEALINHLENHHDLDAKGLQEAIEEIELAEKAPNYSDIIKRAST